VKGFAEILKSEGKRSSGKKFEKMSKTDYEKLESVISKMCSNPTKFKFKKLKRLEDG
jgi:hypothetical protein